MKKNREKECEPVKVNQNGFEKCVMKLNSTISNDQNLNTSTKIEMIEKNLMNFCTENLKNDVAMAGCLFYNSYPKINDVNIGSFLCVTERLQGNNTDFLYPYLNAFICAGWNQSAVQLQMIYDVKTKKCLEIPRLIKANECVKKLSDEYFY